MTNISKSFWNDISGTSVLEVAFVVPIGLFLLLGAIDTSMAHAEKLRVEAAAARAVEQITAFSRVNTDYSASVTEAAAAANVAVSDVTVTYWLECNNVVQSSFTGSCSNSSDQIARFVSVSIRGKFTPVVNFGGFLDTDDTGFVRVQGDASVRIQ